MSPGVASGKARVMLRPDEGQVLPGEEVVVCLPGVRGQSSRVMLAWYRWRTDDEYCWAFAP